MSQKIKVVTHADLFFEEFFPDSFLDVDLKLVTRKPGRMPVGAYLNGIITRDGEDLFAFIETADSSAAKRNPHVFNGRYITITRRDDGSFRPNFKPMPVGMSVNNYAFEVYRELRGSLLGLVGK